MMILEGSNVRLGSFSTPKVTLRKNDFFRITTKQIIGLFNLSYNFLKFIHIGDQNICSISDKNFSSKLQLNDKLFINYHNASLTVKR